MRILVTANHFPAASEPFVVDHVVGLIERGHDVKILRLKTDAGSSQPEKIAKFGLAERTTSMYRDGPRSSMLGLLGIPTLLGICGKLLLRYPADVIPALREGRKSIIRCLPTKAYAEHHGSYDVVHSHFGTSARHAVGLILGGRLSTKVFIPSFLGFDLRYFGEESIKNYRIVFSHAVAVLANSEYTKQQLMALGCPEKKIRVVPVGVNISDWQYRPRSLTNGERLKLLSIGRLVTVKGHINALKALSKLNGTVDFEYTIIGDGPLEQQLTDFCIKNGLQDRVTFLGQVPHAEVIRQVDSAHILLHPSITDENGNQETGGGAVREGAASGALVIASRSGGIPESVIDGETGILVPPGDPDAIARALLKLIDRKREWPRMSETARRVVVQRFDNEKIYDSLQVLYEDCVQNRRLAPQPA